MNILTDPLPVSLEVGGREYPIRSDYRSCLRVILAFEDPELSQVEKQMILLANIYSEETIRRIYIDLGNGYSEVVEERDADHANIPVFDCAAEAARKAVWFLDGGRDDREPSDAPRLYSFSRDANLVFAAFRQTHGVNLQTEDMHWWEFLALFMDIGSETTFCQLTGLRKRAKTGKTTKEERQAIQEMGDLFGVPEVDSRSIEELEAHRRFFELLDKQKVKNG